MYVTPLLISIMKFYVKQQPNPNYYMMYKHAPMFFLYAFILFLFTPARVTAQFFDNNNIRHSSNPRILGFGLAAATVLVVIIIIVLKFCCKNNPRVAIDGSGHRASVGLDRSVLESFPVFKYSEVVGHRPDKGPLECSVCLSSFEAGGDGNEKIRLLPKCKHVFHVGCVDPWFKDHTTCPLCRTNLMSDSDELTNWPKSSQVPEPSRREGVKVNGSDEEDIEQGQSGKYRRWKSTGHVAEVEPMQEDGWKRFTLMLPEEQMKKLGEKNSTLERARSSSS